MAVNGEQCSLYYSKPKVTSLRLILSTAQDIQFRGHSQKGLNKPQNNHISQAETRKQSINSPNNCQLI